MYCSSKLSYSTQWSPAVAKCDGREGGYWLIEAVGSEIYSSVRVVLHVLNNTACLMSLNMLSRVYEWVWGHTKSLFTKVGNNQNWCWLLCLMAQCRNLDFGTESWSKKLWKLLNPPLFLQMAKKQSAQDTIWVTHMPDLFLLRHRVKKQDKTNKQQQNRL